MLTAPRSFSQLATSFFAFLCLGIPTHALSSLTIKFPTAPASHAATAFAFACVRFHLGFRLGPGAGYRFRARSSPKVGSPWKFHSRFTSDLFQTLRTRLLASSALPQTKLETHLQFFCPSSSSIVKDLSCIRTGAGIAARFRLTPMPRKERSPCPLGVGKPSSTGTVSCASNRRIFRIWRAVSPVGELGGPEWS